MHSNKLNILIVDDIKVNRDLLEILLSEHFEERIHCHSVESGILALEVTLTQSIDLVLLDIQMPEMDGFKVAQLLQANALTKDIPIIFISAYYTDERYAQMGFSQGAIDFLSKPINDIQLINKVNLFLSLKEKSIQLIEKEEEEHAIIEHMNDGLINLQFSHQHNDFKIIHANIAFCTMFSKEYATITNHYMSDVFENLDGIGIFEFISTVYNSEKEAHLEIQFEHKKDTTTNIAHYKLFAYKLKNNNVIVIVTDITEAVTFNKKLEQMATTDTLTKLSNRLKFNLILEDKLAMLRREKHANLSLIMFDLDHFKHVNDTYGHDVGDKVLIRIASIVSEAIRNSDLFARWGGEEFIIVCSNTKLSNALGLAEKLREAIEKIDDNAIPKITASFGVTEYLTEESSTKLLKRLDDALYVSKKEGRNCVTSL